MSPVTGREPAHKQIEMWGVIFTVFLVDTTVPPGTYKVVVLIYDANGVGVRLKAQAHRQANLPTHLLHLVKREFNNILCHALER